MGSSPILEEKWISKHWISMGGPMIKRAPLLKNMNNYNMMYEFLAEKSIVSWFWAISQYCSGSEFIPLSYFGATRNPAKLARDCPARRGPLWRGRGTLG
jgi:hypothetical protein